jgi:iron(II)-dependent oxidoreductase
MLDDAPPVPPINPISEVGQLDRAERGQAHESRTGEMVPIEGGAFVMGTDSDHWAYDNERGVHEVAVAAYLIDTTPVTNAAYLEFMDDGGYERSDLWHPDGWRWRNEESATHPLYWRRDGEGSWSVLRFGRRLDLCALMDEPVQHVCWYEADAFARWCGKRLPTETEWEKAATWTSTSGKQRYPWGNEAPTAAHANVGQLTNGPGPVGAHPEGATAHGVHDLIGGVWEWTASDFTAYPEFRAFPYAEYSDVFFGSEHKVLRGGSWAADHLAVRGTFRNWDYPIRRQIFAGFRCARDV